MTAPGRAGRIDGAIATRTMWHRWPLVVAGAVVVVLAGCDGGSSTDTSPTPTVTSADPVPTSPEPASPSPVATASTSPTDPSSAPTTPATPLPTADPSRPPPGPVVTVEEVEPLPPGGTTVRLRPGESVTVDEGVVVELVSLDPSDPECDDCANHAVVMLSTPDSATRADITIGGMMEPHLLEARRRLQVDSWVVRVDAFGDDHLDVTVVDLDD